MALASVVVPIGLLFFGWCAVTGIGDLIAVGRKRADSPGLVRRGIVKLVAAIAAAVVPWIAVPLA